MHGLTPPEPTQNADATTEPEWTAQALVAADVMGPAATTESVFENMGSAFGDLKERLRKQRLVRLTRGNGSGWLTLDVCFCIDNTGSMTPYLSALTSQTDNVLHNLIQGIHAKLYKQFKAITIRIGALAYRDIGDREQFSTLPFQAPPAGKPNEDAKQQEETENKFMAQDEHRFIDWVRVVAEVAMSMEF